MKIVLYALISALSLLFAYLGTPGGGDEPQQRMAKGAGKDNSVTSGDHLSLLGLASR